jgi:hypothetical protein
MSRIKNWEMAFTTTGGTYAFSPHRFIREV